MFTQIHEKVNESLGDFTILFEEFIDDLGKNNIEIWFQMWNNILINQRNLNHQLSIIKMCVNETM